MTDPSPELAPAHDFGMLAAGLAQALNDTIGRLHDRHGFRPGPPLDSIAECMSEVCRSTTGPGSAAAARPGSFRTHRTGSTRSVCYPPAIRACTRTRPTVPPGSGCSGRTWRGTCCCPGPGISNMWFMSTTAEHVGPREQWTPGAGQRKLRELWGDDRIPVITVEDESATDTLIEKARAMIAGHAA